MEESVNGRGQPGHKRLGVALGQHLRRHTAVATTVIRNADWVIAWDEGAGCHTYRRNTDIAFADNTIVFVGRNSLGAVDRVVAGKDGLVLPGLIDIHPPPEHEPLYRGVREEHGLRNMYMT